MVNTSDASVIAQIPRHQYISSGKQGAYRNQKKLWGTTCLREIAADLKLEVRG